MKDKGLQESSQSDENDEVAKGSSISGVRSFDNRDFKVFEKEPRSTQLVFSYQGGKKVPRLKEPRNLYAFSSTEKGLQSLPRWPAHMKIVPIRPNHIEYVPRNPEPFVKADKTVEDADLCKVAYEEGKVVYDNPQGPEKYFMRSRVGGCPVNKWPYHKLKSPDDCTLVFESRFECGNLSRAVKVQNNEYQLWLSNDLYTNKHTQWFYFRVQNTKPGVRYKFTIMNLLKSGSLYNEGMRPLLYSELDAAKKKIGWVRTGDNIKYYKNAIKREDTTKEKYHYSLTWTCEFHNVEDTYYFAHCYPYTYSDLQEYLQNLRSDPVRSKICKQRVLCRTLAGNFVYILTVTNPSRRPADAEAKQGVVLTARVHPGETNSSWMMKGLLDYLTSSAPDAKILRDTFIFKIVPMLNPDGVIIGNYRCSLAGRDLNRNYKTVLKDSFPPIWHVRNMVRKLMEEREITLYCDLHGHSRKQNVFIYGCENRSDPLKRLRERVFPVMMSRNAPSKFSFKGCKFKVQKSKEGTGRIVMWNLGIINSFTMEATFCGSSLGKQAGYHFNTADFESMGFHLCDTLLDYCDPDTSKYVAIVRELELQLKSDILEKMKKKGTGAQNLTVSDIDLDTNYTSDIESSTSGSDSSESDGLPMHLIYAPEGLQMIQEKKKKLKSRKERNKRRAKAMKIKNVLLTDVDKYSVQQQPEIPEEMKLMHQKNHPKRSSQPSPARFKAENPFVHKHEHKSNSRSSTPSSRLGSTRLDSSCRHDYLEAITNAYMMSGVLVTESSEVPHFRYTAGTAYLKEIQSSDRTGSLSRWSTASPGPTQKCDINEEDGHFTVAYLAKQFERKADCTNVFPRSRTEKRVSSALELARKITKYNNRHKTTAITAQETEVQAAPILVPRTPVQPYPYYPWQPTGDCLSSTKARLYEQPNPLKEQDLRKSVSHMSLVDKKGKRATLKNSPGKTVTSVAATEQTNRARADVPVLTKKRQVQQRDVEAEAKADSQGPKNLSMHTVTPQRLDSHPQPQPKVAPRPMKKYTGSMQAGLTPSGIERSSPAVSMTTNATTTSFISNTGVFNGRQSPVYVAVPVDRPPVKVKPSSSGKGTMDTSTISELRSKLLNDLDSRNLVSYGVHSVEDDVQAVLNSSDSKKHGEAVVTERARFAATRKKRHEPNSVTMAAGLASWQEEGIPQAGFGTGKHGRKLQSPLLPAGVVQVGIGLGDGLLADDSKKSARPHQFPISPPRVQESGAAPSTISLTFQFDPAISSREPSGPTQQRQPTFPPQLKSLFRPHAPQHKWQ